MNDTTKPKSMFDQIDGGELTSESPVNPALVDPAAPKTKGFRSAVGAKAVVEAAAAAPKGGKTLEELVSIMLRREAREAEEQENRILTQKAKHDQRTRNAKDKDSQILLRQARCKHLKGGKAGPRNQQVDYAVAAHVFVNATVYIRCLVCGMRWYKEDTAEHLVRKGHKIANHTHKGWREAVQMTFQSSNTQTKSEMLTNVSAQIDSKNLDSVGLPVNAKVVDLEGREVESIEL